MNRRLEGGCQVPIGGYAELQGDNLWLRALVASEDGTRVLHAEGSAPRSAAAQLGHDVAGELLDKGAGDILGEIYGRS
jgi:hydroxymethylbilane synthase